MMSSLPEDIINYNILTRLPLKSLSRFRCVSKSWSNLFTNPNFVKQQLNHSLQHHKPGILIGLDDTNICLVDYDSVSSTVSGVVTKIDYPVEYGKWLIVVGICNGLICYRSVLTYDIIIWNPFTKSYKKLPNPPESTGLNTKYDKWVYGFGYDEKTEDYKFAVMVNCESEYSELHVYSLSTNSWKTMLNIPFLYPFEQLVLFNGNFHWVESPTLDTRLPRVISSFDLESETFKEIQLPQELLDREKFTEIDLCLIEGCLYLIGSIYMTGVEIWMMKQYGDKESWTKMFTIDAENFKGFEYVKLKDSLGNGVILVECSFLSYLYDFNNKEARRLEVDGIPEPFCTWAFLGSLVSPTFGTSLGTQ